MKTVTKFNTSFSKKAVASKLGTHKKSAMSTTMKMSILTQQCFKRFHNTSEGIPHGWKVEMLNEYMKEMQNSGYNQHERKNILIAGFKTFVNLKTHLKNMPMTCKIQKEHFPILEKLSQLFF